MYIAHLWKFIAANKSGQQIKWLMFEYQLVTQLNGENNIFNSTHHPNFLEKTQPLDVFPAQQKQDLFQNSDSPRTKDSTRLSWCEKNLTGIQRVGCVRDPCSTRVPMEVSN